ncbi:hypothetical protein [Clostridium sp. AN503]|uniref:hypothetical protein n=1 Tax=Clostridium sp. AN503 TaxID=3160598 RepID=UPI00345A748E
MQLKTVRGREAKSNKVTIIIRAENQEKANKLLADMKKAVIRENRHMDHSIEFEIFCITKSCNETTTFLS